MLKNKYGVFSLLVFILFSVSVSDAYAAAVSGDVFSKLSSLGTSLGTGLAKSGYYIAGLGLIAFSVAAIFNKISWKTLAYIMMSTFILTLLLSGVIYDALQVNGSFKALGGVKFNGVSGSAEAGQNASSNPTSKSGHH